MTNIIIAGAEGKHNCPLCFRKFMFANGYLQCKPCGIKIKPDDQHLGHWNDKQFAHLREENVECPVCRTSMRFFSRADGYMKAFCPKCKGSIETSDNPEGPGVQPGDLVTPTKEDK